MNYYNSYDMDVGATYIISIEGNEVSQKLTKQCFESCKKVGQPNVIVVPGFDATNLLFQSVPTEMPLSIQLPNFPVKIT